MKRLELPTILLMLIALAVVVSQANAQEAKRRQSPVGLQPPNPPKKGDKAPSIELPKINADKSDGEGELPIFKLAELNDDRVVVLLVLRGWPGYQCPICSRQVGQFLSKADEFKKLGAELVLVYPGPASLLAERATEFQGDRKFPENFHYLIDPDYSFSNDWGLRWDATRETAYPSTFIIGKDGLIKFGETSTTHGGRTSADNVLEELNRLE